MIHVTDKLIAVGLPDGEGWNKAEETAVALAFIAQKERIRSLEADLEARDNAWAVLSGMSNSRIAKLEIKLREVLAALGRPTETLKSSIQAIFDEVSTAKPGATASDGGVDGGG